MARIYYKITCPHCKTLIARGATGAGDSEYLFSGSPIEICPHCTKPYLSGKEYWGILPIWKKISYSLWAYLLAITQPILVCGLAGLLAWGIFADDPSTEVYVYLAVISLVILAAYWILKRFDKIKAARNWKPDQNLIDLYQIYIQAKSAKHDRN